MSSTEPESEGIDTTEVGNDPLSGSDRVVIQGFPLLPLIPARLTLPFSVHYPKERYAARVQADPTGAQAWQLQALDLLVFIARVSTERSIPVRRVRIHMHHAGDHPEHYQALCDFDRRELRFCDLSRDSALHELAHLWSGHDHSRKWARHYLTLCRLYEVRSADLLAEVEDYPVLREVLEAMARRDRRRVGLHTTPAENDPPEGS
ncbi:hypothetical protein UFOVP613_17 [uncultured Caudovirales phage]|uniref:Uncharacterized protein n=1 Tax=uncultured Caudovirales phage TaxID=2100421 RepID=A0A6J5N577_9CAUD|nr:hypothetical protein UFOVP613_17 [uncultured Caudovirales phage]